MAVISLRYVLIRNIYTDIGGSHVQSYQAFSNLAATACIPTWLDILVAPRVVLLSFPGHDTCSQLILADVPNADERPLTGACLTQFTYISSTQMPLLRYTSRPS